MIKINPDDETTLYLTRGDATHEKYNNIAFCYPINNVTTGEVENYKFQPEDEITFVIFEKSGYTRKEILKKKYKLKDIGYLNETEYPELILTEENTKVFELLNKKKTYWYDLVLNDTTTILGYDDENAKKIIVFPGEEED